MATIAFTNNNDPNPALEDVLGQGGTVAAHLPSTFAIQVTGGTLDRFIFRFTSATSSFTYSGTTPTGGTITSADVFDAETDPLRASPGFRISACSMSGTTSRTPVRWRRSLPCSAPRQAPSPVRMALTI
jgi:hypothetical protein